MLSLRRCGVRRCGLRCGSLHSGRLFSGGMLCGGVLCGGVLSQRLFGQRLRCGRLRGGSLFSCGVLGQSLRRSGLRTDCLTVRVLVWPGRTFLLVDPRSHLFQPSRSAAGRTNEEEDARRDALSCVQRAARNRLTKTALAGCFLIEELRPRARQHPVKLPFWRAAISA